MMEIARTLPAAPKVLAGLDALLRDVNVDLGLVADMIRRDAALATQVIRISNSVIHSGGGPRIGAIEEAVARVGFREIYSMVSFASTTQLVERPLKNYDIAAERLRENMLYTAVTCEALAEVAGLDAREAYTAGLLRTLGMLVMDRFADVLEIGRAFEPERDKSYAAWEGAFFGLSNQEIAALILEEWAFPASIVAAVRYHHLEEETEQSTQLASLLYIASAIVSGTQYGLPGEANVWTITPRKLDAARINFAQLDQAGRKALKTFESKYLRYKMEGGAKPAAVSDGDIVKVVDEPKKEPEVKTCDLPPASGVLEEKDESPVHTTPAEVESPDDFTTFMRNYQDMVYTTAARLIGNETQAQDIAQDVFIKAHEHWDNLRGSPTAGGWLKTVATNLSINHIQRYKKRWSFFSDLVHRDDDGGEKEVEFASPDTFFSSVDRTERREWVERALEKLPEHQRVPIVLFHFEEMPYEDIAKKLRVSLSKVKTDILRGREAMAKILLRSGASHEKFTL